MGKINTNLLARIEQVLGIGQKAVYRRIAESNSHALDPNLAALTFAHTLGIGIGRYSTPAERSEIRPFLGLARAAGEAATQPLAQTTAKRAGSKAGARSKPKKDGTVFVVHGRNESLRKSMFDFLGSIGLKPLEWETAVLKAKGGNPFIEDILRRAMDDVQAIVVLLSPDDEARLKPEFCRHGEKRTEGQLTGQARPNVLFEAGWAIGRSPEKTLLVQVGKLRPFTDIGGKHMLHLGNEVAKRLAFANRLMKFKCKIDLSGSDWKRIGDFRA